MGQGQYFNKMPDIDNFKDGDDDTFNYAVMILWIVLNAVLFFYALILFIYAKYYRKAETFHYVLFYIIIIQSNDITADQDSKVYNLEKESLGVKKNKVFDEERNNKEGNLLFLIHYF